MSIDDPSAGFEERLRKLIELRKIEEEKYGALLTRLDEIWQVDPPQETKPKITEIKDHLNHVWDLSSRSFSALENEDRLFWKELARTIRDYLDPLMQHQRDVNSLVVHLLNEYSEAVQHSLERIQNFHYTLIQYFQRVIPVIDTKFREMTGSAENFQHGLREYSDLIFQQLDKKMISLQFELDGLKSLQASVQSLHQLANALNGQSPVVSSDSKPVEGLNRVYLQPLQNKNDEEIAEFYFPVLEQYEDPQNTVVICASNTKLAETCKRLGMETTDSIESIQSRKENSLSGIFCAGFLERLLPETVIKFLKFAHTRLKSGGKIGLATINVGSAASFLENFVTDPADITPWHPETLKYLAAATGFRNPRIVFVNPVRAPHKLRTIPNPGTDQESLLNENFEKLNHLLFDSRHYAVIADR